MAVAAWRKMITCRKFFNLASSFASKNLRLLSTQSKNLSTIQLPKKKQELEAHEDLIEDDPLKHPDYFGVRDLFTIKDLFDARVHLGHKEGSLNDHMIPFIFGSRLGHLIFDLEQTAELLFQALNFTAHIAYRDGIVLLVNRYKQNVHIVEKTAKECGEFAHTRFWMPGTLTNSTVYFGEVTRLPDLIILFNTFNSVFQQHEAVIEAAKMLIPTIGIVDTNCNPTLITYPVPGNDDTPCAIHLYCKLFKQAILKGKSKKKAKEDSAKKELNTS